MPRATDRSTTRRHNAGDAGRPASVAGGVRRVSSKETLSRWAQTAPSELRSADLLNLQRSVGNRMAGQLLQAKLRLGPANDPYEREADQVAQEVVRASRQPTVQRDDAEDEMMQAKPLAGGISQVQRTFVAPPSAVQRDHGQEEEELQASALHGLEGGDVDAGVERSIQSARGGGQPLHDGVRSSMESAFGADFSGVNVHTGPQADALNRSLNAKAFTTGSDIFFGKGQYNPGSSGGQELIAHELTHTVQQGAAGVRRQFRVAGRVQRVVPDVTDYEGVVGSEYQMGTTQYNNSLDNYQRSKTKYEQTHGQNTAGPKITGDMANIFAAVTPNNFDPLTANWQTTIDALFIETLRHAETNWSYSAGGTAGGSMFLTGEGNCGQFATTFVYLVNSLAAKFNVGGLKAGIESKAGDLITDPIATFTNAGVGPGNSLAGQNHPTGNVYAIIDRVDQPIVGNYDGINRARFTNHTWAVVDLPAAGQRTYDVLSKYMGGHQDPTPVAGCGYTFKRAPGNPPGFGGGNYMIRDAVWQQIVELETYANQIRDVDRSLNAVQTMVNEMAQTGYRRGWLGKFFSGWNQDRKVTRQQVTTILKIKRADPTLLDTAIEVLAVASPGPSGRLREIRDLNIPQVAIQNAWARRKE